jgi:hypothetical protein
MTEQQWYEIVTQNARKENQDEIDRKAKIIA